MWRRLLHFAIRLPTVVAGAITFAIRLPTVVAGAIAFCSKAANIIYARTNKISVNPFFFREIHVLYDILFVQLFSAKWLFF